MGEQPIFTTKAHIFQIDASNKKQWVPLSASAVFVQFVYDPQKNMGKIISADSGKAILNSTLHSNVSFLKTSQKFGQWADPKAVTVYGVGFATESDLNKFAEKFRELRELVVSKATQGVMNGSGNGDALSLRSNSTTSAISSITTQQTAGWRLSTSVSMGAVSKPQSKPMSLSASPSETQLSGKTASTLPQTDIIDSNIIIERQRNTSGPCSTTNLNTIGIGNSQNQNQQSPNGKLELEMGALRIENNRLVGALKDANEGIDEWKRKSNDYRDEVHRLRKRLTELEVAAGKNTERELAVDDLQRLVHSYKAKVVKLEEEQRQLNEKLDAANNERETIQRKYDDLMSAENAAKQQLADLHHSVLDKAEELTMLANKLSNVL